MSNDERVLIHEFVFYGFVEIWAERVIADNSDDEWRFGIRKGIVGPFDKFCEVIDENGLELILGQWDFLGVEQRSGKGKGQADDQPREAKPRSAHLKLDGDFTVNSPLGRQPSRTSSPQ